MNAAAVDWGDAPTWVLAVTTSALLVVAAFSLAADRRRLRQIETDQMAFQARLVSAWPEEWSRERTAVRCRNASVEPIYDVRVSVLVAAGSGGSKHMGIMKPGEECAIAFEGTSGVETEPKVSVAFRDAAGRIWCRKAEGALRIYDSFSAIPGSP